MIHRNIIHMTKRHQETIAQMNDCIKSYMDLTDIQSEVDRAKVKDDPNLIYILRPLSLRIFAQRKTEKPEKLEIEISLNQFSLQFSYAQLKSILVFAKLA